MTDLLLITDVPRLRKIFSRLSDSKDIRLRIANNLEKGAEELAAEKPGIVFVQPHLSGLSAEIILMHLKKQLGRRRTRFVLLSTPAQAGSDTMRLYQGLIDTSLDDEALLNSAKELIARLLTKTSKSSATDTSVADPAPDNLPSQQEEAVTENIPAVISPPPPQEPVENPDTPAEEPSLVDQGITYAPRSRVSVYSEFNSSFDSAVNSMKPAAGLDETKLEHSHDWNDERIEIIEASDTRSKRVAFLLWLAPVVIAVVVVTMLQHKRSAPESSIVTRTAQTPAIVPAAPEKISPVQNQLPVPPAAPAQQLKPVAAAAPAEPNQQLSDKAVISAIAENRTSKEQPKPGAAAGRLTTLPDFIPQAALDKAYAKANPGWERYKGQVTEFKVFREGSSIKAIQVIDRGGNGVPESFMKAALRQVNKNQTFVMESTEKKEGYEIQRGHTAENLKVMYYRDDQGGKLRAFVLTWQ